MLRSSKSKPKSRCCRCCKRRFEVVRLNLVDPVISLETGAGGKVNWDFGTGAPAGRAGRRAGARRRFRARDRSGSGSVEIENGTVTYRDDASRATSRASSSTASPRRRATPPRRSTPNSRARSTTCRSRSPATSGRSMRSCAALAVSRSRSRARSPGAKTNLGRKLQFVAGTTKLDDLAVGLGSSKATGEATVATGARKKVTLRLSSPSIALADLKLPPRAAAAVAAAAKARRPGAGTGEEGMDLLRRARVVRRPRRRRRRRRHHDRRAQARRQAEAHRRPRALHAEGRPSRRVGPAGEVDGRHRPRHAQGRRDASGGADARARLAGDRTRPLGAARGGRLAAAGQGRQDRRERQRHDARHVRARSGRATRAAACWPSSVPRASPIRRRRSRTSARSRRRSTRSAARSRKPSSSASSSGCRCTTGSRTSTIRSARRRARSACSRAAPSILRNETLDLAITPRARVALPVDLGQLASLVRVRGSLASPSVGVDAQAAAGDDRPDRRRRSRRQGRAGGARRCARGETGRDRRGPGSVRRRAGAREAGGRADRFCTRARRLAQRHARRPRTSSTRRSASCWAGELLRPGRVRRPLDADQSLRTPGA